MLIIRNYKLFLLDIYFFFIHLTHHIMSKSKVTGAYKRLMVEYKQLTNDPPDGISAGPIDEGNFLEWECLIQGPEETPYEGGIFAATLSFPSEYPLSPPVMKFTTPIYHPNGTVLFSSWIKDTIVCWNIKNKKKMQKQVLTSFIVISSLQGWQGLHLDSSPSWRWSQHVRIRFGTLESHSKCRKDSNQCHEHACRTQRRITCKYRCGQDVARK